MLFYAIALRMYVVLLNSLSMFGNTKAKLWLIGRRQQKEQRSTFNVQRSTLYWFHCASLGEYEQGKPLIKALKQQEPNAKILVTFFSPSGYEQKKNDALLDYVFYLPIDSKKNAREFLDKFNPSKVFFIKYDFWFFYFKEIQQRNIPLYVVSGLFRENQWFFKWYGSWFLNALKNVTHFFVQDEKSKQILFQHDIKNVSVTGDTRFDNVTSDALKPNALIDNFCKESEIIIMGSSWQDEEQLMSKVFSELPSNVKLIIVPHDVSKSHIQEIEQKFSSFYPIKFSEGKITNSRVLIVDAIGVLKYAYSQSSIAIVGGGFKNTLHNILEPAVCGLPVLHGNNFKKYPEGNLLINAGGGFVFENASQLKFLLEDLLKEKKYQVVGKLSKQFVESNKGATEKILKFIS
ncbi:MAG: 3-deoxy-D-manno-octulosonic acid transferase [Bacteroidia bacterium]